MIARGTDIRGALRSRQRGFLLNPYRFGLGSGSDPYFSSVSLLLQGDGANGSTTIMDSSSAARTPQTRVGTVVSSAQGLFGGQSLYSAGSAPNMLLYDWVAALHLDGDFSIEFWLRPTGPATYKQDRLINMGGGVNIAWPSYQIAYDHTSEIPYLNFCGSSTNTGTDIGAEIGAGGRMGVPALDAWNFVMVTRSGNVWQGSINGVVGLNITSAKSPYNSGGARGLQIGGRYDYAWNSGSPACPMAGYLRGLRITKGVARSHTVPDAPFPVA